MNASEITYGVEIECYFPAAAAPICGAYHRGLPVAGLPLGWNAQRDGSLGSPPEPGFVGVEIVSGILKGKEGLDEIKLVCAWLKAKGAKVNQSTGLHIHVGFANQTPRALAQLVCLVARNEKAFFAVTGTKSREQNHFCKPIREQFRQIGKNGKLKEGRGRNARCVAGAGDRYHLLNLSNLANGTRPTVEFRCFAGTTNYTKISGCVQICVGLVEKAIKSKGKVAYDAKSLAVNSRVTRAGEGETAVNRLFYAMFWKFGGEFRPDSVDPKWAPLGVLDKDTLAACGKLLLKMARKYDGNLEVGNAETA